MARRSERNKAAKYAQGAKTLLDSYHWQSLERCFLGILESGAISMAELRELRWNQVQDSSEGILIKGFLTSLREEVLQSFRQRLQEGCGFYQEALTGPGKSSLLFAQRDIKGVVKELDQLRP